MNELKIFKNNDFGEIRTVTINGEPHFVGKDVAEILEYQNGSRDIKKIHEWKDRTKHPIPITDTTGRVQGVWFIKPYSVKGNTKKEK